MRGERRLFPRHRLTVLEILRAARTVPSFPLLRKLEVGKLEAARRELINRVGWTAIFAKAYALVCQRHPELRDIFVRRPFLHLYRHPHSVLSVSIHRQDDRGQERLIWGQLSSIESIPLSELQGRFDSLQTAPLREVYRDGLILESAPRPLRRLVWWWVMRFGARKRAKHIGTFSISSLAGYGCLNANHPLITPTSLAFGPIDSNGSMEVVLLCDHRMMDGVLGARALQCLQEILNGEILAELRGLNDQHQASQVA